MFLNILANYYYELAAAIEGNVEAMHNLGLKEKSASNMSKALKHFLISASGLDISLMTILQLYSNVVRGIMLLQLMRIVANTISGNVFGLKRMQWWFERGCRNGDRYEIFS